jgi:hypothetical protein
VTPRITVDITGLADLAVRLRALRQEFDGVEDVVRGYEEAVGSREVASALDAFAGNWSHERKQIAKQLDEVAGYVQAAAEAYASVESELSGHYESQEP